MTAQVRRAAVGAADPAQSVTYGNGLAAPAISVIAVVIVVESVIPRDP